MIKSRLLVSLFVLSTVFSFAGCGRQEDIKKIDLNKTEKMRSISQEPLKIKIGIVPEEDIRKMAIKYEPLAEYLSKKINLKVTLVYLDNYGEVCDKFIYKQLDAAFFGSFSYTLTHAKAGVEPIARPDYKGTSTYRGLIVVREDSNIKNTADMRAKRLALVHQATYAGYIYPLYYFKKHGIDNLESYFSDITFRRSHDEAIFALLSGEADVATAKDLVYQRLIADNSDLAKKLAVLAVSEPVPSNALCVSKDLDSSIKEKLKDILLNLNEDPEAKPILGFLGATKFIETKDEDYHHLYEIIKVLGIDLNTYPYYERPDMGFGRIEDAKGSR